MVHIKKLTLPSEQLDALHETIPTENDVECMQ